MAKKRYVNTRFWQDNYIVGLDPVEKLLYLYLLTNPLTDICGIYELPMRQVAFDTGIDKEMVLRIFKRFESDQKIYYVDGWVCITNFIKHQTMNAKVVLGIKRSFSEIDPKVLAKLKDKGIDFDSLPIDYEIPKPKLKPKLKLIESRNNGDKSPTLEELIIPFREKYDSTLVEEFMLYWTEKNPGGRKERWEMQKVFDPGRRLATWAKRQKSFGSSGVRELHDGTKAKFLNGRWVDASDINVKIDLNYYPELTK